MTARLLYRHTTPMFAACVFFECAYAQPLASHGPVEVFDQCKPTVQLWRLENCLDQTVATDNRAQTIVCEYWQSESTTQL